MISVFNVRIFSSREVTLFLRIVFVLSGTIFSLFVTDGVSQFTGSWGDSYVSLGRRRALTK